MSADQLARNAKALNQLGEDDLALAGTDRHEVRQVRVHLRFGRAVAEDHRRRLQPIGGISDGKADVHRQYVRRAHGPDGVDHEVQVDAPEVAAARLGRRGAQEVGEQHAQGEEWQAQQRRLDGHAPQRRPADPPTKCQPGNRAACRDSSKRPG